MADYRVYDGVKKLQRYLNTLTLGVPKLTVDGKFGPKTDTAARTWLGLQPAGTVFPTGLAVAAGLSDADVAEVVAAAGTYGSTVA
jgi:peptidoglycan hydrolase-like protein with peptidoglycan-binding domain